MTKNVFSVESAASGVSYSQGVANLTECEKELFFDKTGGGFRPDKQSGLSNE
jgi:hypothetical protein